MSKFSRKRFCLFGAWNLRTVVFFPYLYLFYFFFHHSMFDGVHFQYSQVFVSFISLTVLIFSCFGIIIGMAHFIMPNFIPISWLYILTACIGVSNSFPFLQIWCRPCIWGGWFFSCDIWSLYPPVHFLSIWFSGIIAITNSNNDSASPWKIRLWIFTSVKLFPPAVSSTLQFCMVFSINFMTSPDI